MRGSISSGPIFAGPEPGSIQQGVKEKAGKDAMGPDSRVFEAEDAR